MNRFMLMLLLPAVAISTVLVTGCDSGDEDVILELVTARDVPADPSTGRDPNTGQALGTTNMYTFYSLRENKIILAHTEPNRADSASDKWDIAFRASTILLNGNGIGGGQGGGQIVASAFEDITEAPANGYTASSMGLDSAPIKWGTYDPVGMLVLPLANQTLLVKTGDGNGYAKIRILSYYKGAPQVPDAFADPARYFTFEYLLQEDGRRFE